jgi:SAM-dependent methyltransferase
MQRTPARLGMTPESRRELAERLYDDLAERYDEEVGGTAGAALAKSRSTLRLRELFHEGDRVLDVGCGTGADACLLASHGVRVVALDISVRMLELTRERAERKGVSDRIETVHLPTSEAGTLVERWGPASFGGAYSLFGTLNLDDSPAAARDGLAALLKPGAPFVAGLVNPTVLWEVFLYPLLLRFEKPARKVGRNTQMAVSKDRPERIPVFLFSVDEFAEAMRPSFELVSVEGTNILVPPPHLDKYIRRLPRLAGALARAERRIAGKPPWNRMGYFSLLTFRRVGA